MTPQDLIRELLGHSCEDPNCPIDLLLSAQVTYDADEDDFEFNPDVFGPEVRFL